MSGLSGTPGTGRKVASPDAFCPAHDHRTGAVVSELVEASASNLRRETRRTMRGHGRWIADWIAAVGRKR